MRGQNLLLLEDFPAGLYLFANLPNCLYGIEMILQKYYQFFGDFQLIIKYQIGFVFKYLQMACLHGQLYTFCRLEN